MQHNTHPTCKNQAWGCNQNVQAALLSKILPKLTKWPKPRLSGWMRRQNQQARVQKTIAGRGYTGTNLASRQSGVHYRCGQSARVSYLVHMLEVVGKCVLGVPVDAIWQPGEQHLSGEHTSQTVRHASNMLVTLSKTLRMLSGSSKKTRHPQQYLKQR